jgi:hypothetical protein
VLAVDVRIDHRALRARCGGAASEGGSLALAPTARLANTPIQLLLPPLATSRERELEVENVICRGAPRLMTMRAERKRTEPWPRRPRVVRVEYGPSGLLGALAGLVSARVSFWFDPADVSPWIAHRMPLEPGGRPVWVVREAVALPADLIPARN